LTLALIFQASTQKFQVQDTIKKEVEKGTEVFAKICATECLKIVTFLVKGGQQMSCPSVVLSHAYE